MLRLLSSCLSAKYVRGLKERSEVAVASVALRPCQLWSTEGKETEGEEDSHACLLKASLSVAFRLGGTSREESMLLPRSQSHVWRLSGWR